jgi:hypothetical protein
MLKKEILMVKKITSINVTIGKVEKVVEKKIRGSDKGS